MTSRVGLLAAAVLAAVPWGLSGGPSCAEGDDKALPEPVAFLMEASDEMIAYHREHKRYAREWHQLGFSFACPPYRVTDPGVYPRKEDRNRWRPKGCAYTYVIEAADNDNYLIQAVNKDGRVEYEMQAGMRAPRKTPETRGPR